MKHTKHELMLYSFYDFTGLASHLEAMAAKGWLAEKIGVLGIRYRRIQPQTLRFSVTYFPDASEFDAAPTGGQEVFRDYCAQAGWEFAFQWAQMQVFYTSRPDAVPIETDPSIQVETLHRSMRRNFLPGTILMLILSLFQLGMLFWRINTDPVDLLSNASYLLSFSCWLLVLVANVWSLGHYALWHRRAVQEARMGRMYAIRTSPVTTLSLLFVALLFIVAAFLFSSSRREIGYLGIAVVTVVLTCCLTQGVKAFCLHRGASRGVTRTATMATAFLSSFGLLLAVGFLFITNRWGVDDTTAVETYSWHNITWEVYADPIPLRVEDLTGAAIYGPDTYSTGSWEQSSFLVSWRSYSQDLRHDCPEELPELSYSIVDVKVPLFYSLCKTYLLEQYIRRDANLPPEYQEHYQALDTLPQGTAAAYQCYMGGEPMNQYLFCWDSHLAELWFDEPLTAAQLNTAAAILADA